MEVTDFKTLSEGFLRLFSQAENFHSSKIIFQVIGGILDDGLVDGRKGLVAADAKAFEKFCQILRLPAVVMDADIGAGIKAQQKEGVGSQQIRAVIVQ